MKKKIYLILLFIWLFVIYYLSNQSGDISGGNSGNLIKDTLILFFDVFKLPKDNIDSIVLIIHNPIRELMHMMEYFILGFLVINNLINFKIKDNIYIITILFSFIYASLDEIHQLFIPGRIFEYFDILMDMLGTLLITILFYLVKNRNLEKSTNTKN